MSLTDKTDAQLLKIWRERRNYRKKRLAKLKAADKPNAAKIATAEYRLLVAQLKVNVYKKKVAKTPLKVHAPPIKVDRARYGNVHGRLDPKVVVLHSTESHDRPGTGDVEAILKYLENTREGLGIHYTIDKEGNVGRGALHNHKVYHARGANSTSIGIEQIGFAHSTAWKREDRQKQLERVAKVLAYISVTEGIPLKHSTTHGVAMHRDFPAGGHTDPGNPKTEYPFYYVLQLAQKYKKGW